MRIALLSLAALLGARPALADDAPTLANNPFLRPQLVERAPAADPAASPLLELRAILSAGDASRVDVGGHIVGVGEEVNGYRLISVSEDGAVFEHAGRSIHVPLAARAATADDGAPVTRESGDAS